MTGNINLALRCDELPDDRHTTRGMAQAPVERTNQYVKIIRQWIFGYFYLFLYERFRFGKTTFYEKLWVVKVQL